MNGKSQATEETDNIAEKPETPVQADVVVTMEALKVAWNEFTEQRKEQVGEYHLLKQEFTFQDNVVTIHLSNAVEEPLLHSIRVPLTEFLRQKLGNSRINVTSEIREVQTQKFAYTNKEKFDKLADKNPILKELKERLDLDPDF